MLLDRPRSKGKGGFSEAWPLHGSSTVPCALAVCSVQRACGVRTCGGCAVCRGPVRPVCVERAQCVECTFDWGQSATCAMRQVQCAASRSISRSPLCVPWEQLPPWCAPAHLVHPAPPQLPIFLPGQAKGGSLSGPKSGVGKGRNFHPAALLSMHPQDEPFVPTYTELSQKRCAWREG